jgi:VCBS repeat-containing protein
MVDPPGVLGNDTDVDDGDTLTVTAVNGQAGNVGMQITLASGALLTVNPDGSYIYDPNGRFESLPEGVTATDSFTYMLRDSEGAASTAAVTITIVGVNDAPTANPTSISATEDGPNVPLAFSGDDVDNDDNPSTLTFAVDQQPSEGQVIPSGNGFVFTTAGDFQDLAPGEPRIVTFTYVSIDSHGANSAPATVSVTVTGVNDAPVANTQNVAAVEDGGPVSDSFAGDDVDSDDDQGSLSYTIVTQPIEGSVINNGDGTFSFNPGTGFQDLRTGEIRDVTFTYTATDSHNATSTTGTITVTVTGVNEPPVAVDDPVETFRNTAATFDLAANDFDVDGAIVVSTIQIVSQPANGTLTVNANGTVMYTPRANFAGVDAFTYRIQDDEGAFSNVATVSIAILNPPNSWQNPQNFNDVNDDGLVTVLDALLVVNDIRDNMQFTNGVPVHDLNNVNQLQVAPFRRPFVDPTGDGFVRIDDILAIITALRLAQSGSPEAGGEGESESESLEAAPLTPLAPLTIGPQLLPAASDEEPFAQPAIVTPALDAAAPPAAIETESSDAAFNLDDEAGDLDDLISTIADDVAGHWSEI